MIDRVYFTKSLDNVTPDSVFYSCLSSGEQMFGRRLDVLFYSLRAERRERDREREADIKLLSNRCASVLLLLQDAIVSYIPFFLNNIDIGSLFIV